ncbi:S1 family peptidase [Nonomuraea longicatena]|uniref:S1 family peptidase n=1 Tax=Nonomuraea longicatena TaxID=83682 RepID=A0ABP3ZTH1_9ACTN
MKRPIVVLSSGALLLSLALVRPAEARTGPPEPSAPTRQSVSPAPTREATDEEYLTLAAASLAEQSGLPPAELKERLRAERGLADRLAAVTGRLGPRAAGGWIDVPTGTVHVNVLDERAARTATDDGAQAHLVSNSTRTLQTVHSKIDKAAQGRLVSAYVDVRSNQVVIEVPSAEKEGTASVLARAGLSGSRGTVKVVATDSAAEPSGLIGGDKFEMWNASGTQYQGDCSAAFLARNRSTGWHYMVTAGHCNELGGNTWAWRPGDNKWVGYGHVWNFDYNGDYGSYFVRNSGEWNPYGPWVNMYNGTFRRIGGAQDAPVGAHLCKSGATTGWTCGFVNARDVTVTYANGPTVGGLTMTDYRSRPGDSGGSVVWNNDAAGIHSGSRTDGSAAYFQPIREALAAQNMDLILD